MNTFFKANCLGAFALALLSLVWALPWGLGPVMQNIALALLVIHVLEAIVAFKYIKTYQGPLWHSLLLALLFGLLHWLPLARAAKATGRG
jgi:uncharacterized protein YhhL (DUF1145 family)